MMLIITREVTDNSPLGEPTPPPDDGGATWHAVRFDREQTTWRCVRLQADGRSERAKRLQEIGSARWLSEGRRLLEQSASQASPEEIEEILYEVLDLINELDEDE